MNLQWKMWPEVEAMEFLEDQAARNSWNFPEIRDYGFPLHEIPRVIRS